MVFLYDNGVNPLALILKINYIDVASVPKRRAKAVERRLGLKFETHKRPEPVLAIDPVDDKPTETEAVKARRLAQTGSCGSAEMKCIYLAGTPRI
jgi:hypothetical protein